METIPQKIAKNGTLFLKILQPIFFRNYKTYLQSVDDDMVAQIDEFLINLMMLSKYNLEVLVLVSKM